MFEFPFHFLPSAFWENQKAGMQQMGCMPAKIAKKKIIYTLW
jgi:hypothetical protein